MLSGSSQRREWEHTGPPEKWLLTWACEKGVGPVEAARLSDGVGMTPDQMRIWQLWLGGRMNNGSNAFVT
jgi:hypothetical protein